MKSLVKNNRFLSRRNQYTISLFLLILVIGFIIGEELSYSVVLNQVSELQSEVQSLRNQILATPQSNITYMSGNTSISQLYQYLKDSIVAINGIISTRTIFGNMYGVVEGTGFVYNLTGKMVILTNFHVVEGASNITVTFSDGDSYAASILGSDPYADLAALLIKAPYSEFKPLSIVSSTDLKVGDPVIAIGNPFGLTGSVTTGIISQLGRTITEQLSSGSYEIADVIQISASINPGNSGGPLLNYRGEVIGITTATVSGSQGLGFAIPSSTILKEVETLVDTGSYTSHPWLGATGTDMNYYIAKAIHSNVTYGWLIQNIVSGSPAERAGLRGGNQYVQIAGNKVMLGGDIIVAINDLRVVKGDDLFSYLERYMFPGQTANITILRDGQKIDITIVLSSKPLSSS